MNNRNKLDDKFNKWYQKIEQPEDSNATIWRYMDFTKFMSLLEEKSLFFSRLDLLGDKFEGSVPKINYDSFHSHNYDKSHYKEHEEIHKVFRTYIFVSCWHLCETENAALWKIYGITDRSIAIKSSYAKLRNLSNAKVGLIKYINYIKKAIDSPCLEELAMTKWKFFSHESEVRALVWSENTSHEGNEVYLHTNDIEGINIPINLTDLVEEIVVSPNSKEWFHSLVQNILKRYDLSIPVTKSEMDMEPCFGGLGYPVND